jgi:hypothetical protein
MAPESSSREGWGRVLPLLSQPTRPDPSQGRVKCTDKALTSAGCACCSSASSPASAHWARAWPFPILFPPARSQTGPPVIRRVRGASYLSSRPLPRFCLRSVRGIGSLAAPGGEFTHQPPGGCPMSGMGSDPRSSLSWRRTRIWSSSSRERTTPGSPTDSELYGSRPWRCNTTPSRIWIETSWLLVRPRAVEPRLAGSETESETI